MRLTLRTLLAYLDNTLDAQDAELLRSKLTESGFATQLVQRIRGSLNDQSLLAPSPEAVGPVEEANVISEYLDSTLPAEQVAEIERACLESDPHLAEAAACHQILTMVLGKPAEVSPELRQRIYELPDRKIEDIPLAGSFSSVAIPIEEPQLDPLSDGFSTADGTSARAGEPIEPVGVADSGVSDAPTRLREAENADAAAAVGRKGSRLRDSKIYTGSIRPSRIAPWLVSLGLAAVLLFALTRIFQPLFDQKSASLDQGMTESPVEYPTGADDAEIEVPPEQSPPMVDVESSTTASDDSLAGDDAEALPATEAEPSAAEPLPVVDTTSTASDESGQSETPPSDPVASAPSATTTDAEMDDATADKVAVEDATAKDSPVPAPPVPQPPAPQPPASTTVMEDADQPVPPPAQDVVEPAKNEVAKVTGQEAFLAGLAGEQWLQLTKDMTIVEGMKVAWPPTFRGQMEIADASVTMVGPAQIQWSVGDDDAVTLSLEYGRVLVTSKKAGATLNVRLGDQPIQLDFADVETVAAASVQHFRAPGFDPLRPESRIPLARVLSAQGSFTVTDGETEDALDTGQQWVKRGSTVAKVSAVESVPDWIDPPDPGKSTLDATARAGLLELLEGDQPLEIALRESTLFRRSEVGALAAQTLLVLGRPDVYFGGDGVLSEAKQRAYWPDHFALLLATVDRSAESAEQLRKSIDSMDSANVEPLFRLLTGYSQKQLVEGGDEELVELLDSGSMAVRVLALENLHRITGTTLYFRAEQENAIRRAPVIKKWITRKDKGDIRWQD